METGRTGPAQRAVEGHDDAGSAEAAPSGGRRGPEAFSRPTRASPSHRGHANLGSKKEGSSGHRLARVGWARRRTASRGTPRSSSAPRAAPSRRPGSPLRLCALDALRRVSRVSRSPPRAAAGRVLRIYIYIYIYIYILYIYIYVYAPSRIQRAARRVRSGWLAAARSLLLEKLDAHIKDWYKIWTAFKVVARECIKLARGFRQWS